MNFPKSKHGHHLDKKLRFRIRMYFVISIILLGIVIYEIVLGKETGILSLIGLAVGSCIGILTARIFLLSWDKDAKKVISRLDVIGGIIIVFYIVLAIFRNKIIGQLVQG